MTTKVERYVKARLAGKGPRPAGRFAGYEHGPPSSAEKMAELAQKVREMPDAADWVPKQLEQAREKVRELRELSRAIDILDRIDR